jgi:transposase
MLTRETWQAIADRAALGWGRRGIASDLGLDVKTVRRYLAQGGWRARQARTIERLIDDYVDFLIARAPEVDYRARILYREIREKGYAGSYRGVARFVAPLRQARRRAEVATVRFETPPGKQSQVDWGSSWVWFGEERELAHFFVLTLGYSRRMYVRAYPNERLASLIDGHEHAFEHFGGRTEEILYDNPRSIVLERDAEGRVVRWNPTFRDFADSYGFEPRLCRVGRARTKGKVERGIGYFKGSALPGKRFHGFEHLNEWALEWTTTEADLREHGTTHERPIDRFGRESLIPVGARSPYRVERSLRRVVGSDGLVELWTSRYSVPYPYVGEEVTVVATPGEVAIYHGGEAIARHAPSSARHRVVRDPAHYEGLLRVGGERRRAEPPRFDPRFVGTDLVEVRDLAVYEAIAEGARR